MSTALPWAALFCPLLFYSTQLFTIPSPRKTEMERQRERKGRTPSWDGALNEHNQVFTCRSREGCQDAGKHHVGRLGGIHRRMDPSLAVVGDQGRGLRVIGLQAGFQGCFVIVRTADQGLSSDLREARGQSPALAAARHAPPFSPQLRQPRLPSPRSAGDTGQTHGSQNESQKVTEERRIQHRGLSPTHHSAC